MKRPRPTLHSFLRFAGGLFLAALAVAVLVVSITFALTAGELKGDNERLRSRLDEQQTTIEDLIEAEASNTVVVEYIRDSEVRGDCIRDLAIAADLAYGRLIVAATSLPEGERIAADHPTVQAYERANARLVDYDVVCPLAALQEDS